MGIFLKNCYTLFAFVWRFSQLNWRRFKRWNSDYCSLTFYWKSAEANMYTLAQNLCVYPFIGVCLFWRGWGSYTRNHTAIKNLSILDKLSGFSCCCCCSTRDNLSCLLFSVKLSLLNWISQVTKRWFAAVAIIAFVIVFWNCSQSLLYTFHICQAKTLV